MEHRFLPLTGLPASLVRTREGKGSLIFVRFTGALTTSSVALSCGPTAEQPLAPLAGRAGSETGRHPGRPQSSHRNANSPSLRRHSGPIRRRRKEERVGARKGLVTPGRHHSWDEIKSESWAIERNRQLAGLPQIRIDARQAKPESAARFWHRWSHACSERTRSNIVAFGKDATLRARLKVYRERQQDGSWKRRWSASHRYSVTYFCKSDTSRAERPPISAS
jgi:hypothetical protein